MFMNKGKTMRLILSLVLCVSCAPIASAAITYDMFFRAGVFDGFDNNLVVDPNSTIGQVEIILQENTTAGETSDLEGGMRGIAVDIFSTSPDSFLNLAANPGFQFEGNGADEDTISAFNFAGSVPATRVDADTVEFTLGTLDLIAPAAGGSTTFSLADVDPNNGNLQTETGSLDDQVRYRTFTITAIPEPGALVALFAVGTCTLLRRRR